MNESGWKAFPYGDRAYRYAGSSLQTHWVRLHRGDREFFPSSAWVAWRVRLDPALGEYVSDPLRLSRALQDAWRAYHAGDFSRAVSIGLAQGPLGFVVAGKAAVSYVCRLEEDEPLCQEILAGVVVRAALLTRLAPSWPNAWFVHAAALARYCQGVSLPRALVRGRCGRVRRSLDKVFELEPDHAEAHVEAGAFHGELVLTLGPVLANALCGARLELAEQHFAKALALTPDSITARTEYAAFRSLVDHQPDVATKLREEVMACQATDASERLDLESARAELEEEY